MSSFQFQISNFMSAMAAASNAQTTTSQPEIEDFSPDSSHRLERQTQPVAQSATSIEYLRPWLPSVEMLVASWDLAPYKQETEHEQEAESKSVRNFETFIAQLESPSASAFESYDRQQMRIILSERSLTYADFRHAVDHRVDYASSTWQNN